MSQQNRTTQSVILNLNKNYANSKAHDFLQPVAQQFDIGANAEVSLYNCKLTRKPIFLESNVPAPFSNECGFVMNMNYFPSEEQLYQISLDTGNLIVDDDDLPILDNANYYDINDIDFNLKSSGYTVDEFGVRTSQAVNTIITQVLDGIELKKGDGSITVTVGGKDCVISFPYQYIYDRDPFYMGFAGLAFTPYKEAGINDVQLYSALNNCQVLNVESVENNEAFKTADVNLEIAPNDILRGIQSITSNSTVANSSYTDFSRVSDSPLFPLMKCSDSKFLNGKFQQTESYFEFDIYIDDKASHDYDMVMGFTNTYLQSNWTTSSTPAEGIYEPTGENVPEVLLGARFIENKNGSSLTRSSIELYLPVLINQRENILDGTDLLANVFADGLQKITTIDMLDNLDGLGFSSQGKFGFRFVAHTNQANTFEVLRRQGNITGGEDKNFERVYSFQFYCRNPTSEDVLYDSAKHCVYLPANLLETGFLINSIKSNRVDTERVMLGFQPYMFIKSMDADDGITNPRGNFILQKDHDADNVAYRTGIDYYTYKIKNTTLNNVLGLEKEEPLGTQSYKLYTNQEKTEFREIFFDNLKRFDPNAYPQFLAEGGLTRLFTDNIQYNIELNLPIRAFNTTKPTTIIDSPSSPKNVFISNLGQKRAIVYQTPPLIEGETTGLTQTFINVFKEPNNLKQLTLNNNERINLNEMKVQVRRSNTNELATELEDCSVELLITSDN